MLANSPVQAVIAVSDLAKVRPFYEEKLGLKQGQSMDEGGVIYELGGGTTLLVYPTTYERGGATNANFVVTDFDETIADLKSRGVAFEEYDIPGVFKTEDGVATMDTPMGEMKSAWCKDPDDNIIAITQYPTGG